MDIQTAAPSNFYRSPPASSPWNDENINCLTSLYREGFSASQIAKRMPVDMTRNAVIGKIHRLGLVPLGKAVRPKSDSTVRAARKIEAARKQAMRRRELRAKARHLLTLAPDFDGQPLPKAEPYVNSLNLSFDDLTRFSCRWIDGDPREGAGFCGHEQVAGSSYCQHHYALTVQAVKPKWTAPIEQRIREPA